MSGRLITSEGNNISLTSNLTSPLSPTTVKSNASTRNGNNPRMKPALLLSPSYFTLHRPHCFYTTHSFQRLVLQVRLLVLQPRLVSLAVFFLFLKVVPNYYPTKLMEQPRRGEQVRCDLGTANSTRNNSARWWTLPCNLPITSWALYATRLTAQPIGVQTLLTSFRRHQQSNYIHPFTPSPLTDTNRPIQKE